MSASNDFAPGPGQSIRDTEQSPNVDSGSSSQPVGPDSPLEQIVAFGRAANEDVRRGEELQAEGLSLQFLGTLDVILALYWAKLRIEDDDRVAREAKRDAFLHAAKQMAVAHAYAYALLKLHNRVTGLRTWGEVYKREHGKYPSRHAMIEHCGVGFGKRRWPSGRPVQRDRYVERMQHEIERLRTALGDAEAREAELRKILTERDTEVANLQAQFLFNDDKQSTHSMDSHSRESYEPSVAPERDERGQSLEARFGKGFRNASFGGRTYEHKPLSDEKTTPDTLFERFGQGCTMDAACTHENARCGVHLTKQEDALNCIWPRGHIAWLNPPYKSLLWWVRKAVDYVEGGGGKAVRMLLPAWTDMQWFFDFAPLGNITFICNRFAFGGMKAQAPFASILIEWTPQSVKAGRERLARGDTNLQARLDPLPPLHWRGRADSLR